MQQVQTIEPNALYRVEDVAALLNVGGSTIRRWVQDGRLKARKPGKSYLVRGQDLLDLPEADPEDGRRKGDRRTVLTGASTEVFAEIPF